MTELWQFMGKWQNTAGKYHGGERKKNVENVKKTKEKGRLQLSLLCARTVAAIITMSHTNIAVVAVTVVIGVFCCCHHLYFQCEPQQPVYQYIHVHVYTLGKSCFYMTTVY